MTLPLILTLSAILGASDSIVWQTDLATAEAAAAKHDRTMLVVFR